MQSLSDIGEGTSFRKNQDGPNRSGNLWGIVLAGGDGQRVRQLMHRVTGADRPKQYCAVVGRRSMFQHTLDRIATCIPRQRIVTVITQGHVDRAREQLEDLEPELLVIQPRNRETAPGILLPLLWIHARDPEATVVIFPSDHFILEEAVFMDHVLQAVQFLAAHPWLLILLGMAPDRPEPAYGWIEPGEELERRWEFGLFRVRRFWEKPDPATAQFLYLHGCLWNSLVLAGRLQTFLQCIRHVLPELWVDFQAIGRALGTARETTVVNEVYRKIPAVNLSRALLEKIPHRLGVVPVKGVCWSDWGEERRIFETVAQIGKAEELMARLGESGGRPSKEAA